MSGRCKPPTQADGFRITPGIQYAGIQYGCVPQSTMFKWRPLAGRPISRCTPTKEQFFYLYRVTTMFWANDSGTFLQVPFDCTLQDVENPMQDDSEFEDDTTSLLRQSGATWRRLRFHNHPPEHSTISCVRYEGANFLARDIPSRWKGTLMPSVHEQPGTSLPGLPPRR